jgi:hypothetical protein
MEERRRKELIKWARDLVISVVLLPAILVYFHVSPPVIIAGAIGLLIILSLWERWPVNAWGPWVLIIGGPILGTIWFALINWQPSKLNKSFAAPAIIRRSPPSQNILIRGDLSSGEKDRLGTVIYEISEILHKEGEPLVLASQKISESRSIRAPELQDKIKTTLLTPAEHFYNDLFNKYAGDHQFYNHEIFKILENDGVTNKFVIAIGDYVNMIDRLKGLDPAQTANILEFPDKQLKIATLAFQQWLVGCQQRISIMKTALR